MTLRESMEQGLSGVYMEQLMLEASMRPVVSAVAPSWRGHKVLSWQEHKARCYPEHTAPDMFVFHMVLEEQVDLKRSSQEVASILLSAVAEELEGYRRDRTRGQFAGAASALGTDKQRGCMAEGR